MLDPSMLESLLPDEDIVRPTSVEIDLEALAHNARMARQLAGPAAIMGVVKANAYGHGLAPVAQALIRAGVDQLGVALLEEGILLRKAGITAPILVLGAPPVDHLPYFLKYDMMITVPSVFKLERVQAAAEAVGKIARIHLKVDTGMERIGIHHYHADTLFEAALAARSCEVVGVFSHFAQADSDDSAFTQLQLERLLDVLEFYPRHSLPMPTRHIANSAALLQYPESVLDMVRPGIMLYGAYPSEETRRTVQLRPVMSFKTRVVYFKVVPAGAPVSYGGAWAPARDTRVITLPVGYGDGYPRALSNRGPVLLNGRRHSVAGKVCMDQLMVDIDGDSAYNGDEAVLIGAQGEDQIRCEELAALAGFSPYELLTGINSRVPRMYRGGSN